MSRITTIDELEDIYGHPAEASRIKVVSAITSAYRTLIEASPFCALATCGPEGLDCSPRGDIGSCVRIEDDRTLLMPDRRGNNRTDSLRNIIRDQRVSLMFMFPGHGNVVRVNGRAHVSVDADLLASFTHEGKPPRSVIVIEIDEVYFQCARAIMRSGLWDTEAQTSPNSLPTPGEIMQEIQTSFEGDAYDNAWSERAKTSMW